jgi:peptide/nickel transport system substrate-binding protein
MRFDVIPEATVLGAALESGQQQVIFAPDSQVAVLEANKSLQSTEFFGRAVGMLYINHGLPPLDNADFRRALAWGFDKEAYGRAFFGGRQPVAQSYLTPSSWAYHPVPHAPKYDLAKAREYMQRSGIPESARTFTVSDAGTNIYGGSEALQMLQQQWSQIGVTIRLSIGQQAFQGHGAKAAGNDGTYMALAGLSMRADPDAHLSILVYRNGPFNWGLVPCPGTEELIEKARGIYDTEERKKLYFEADEIAVRELYSGILSIITSNRAYATKQVRGLDRLWGGEGKERYVNLWLA